MLTSDNNLITVQIVTLFQIFVRTGITEGPEGSLEANK